MRFILNLSLILTIASCNVTNNQTEESFSILSDLEGKSFDLNHYQWIFSGILDQQEFL